MCTIFTTHAFRLAEHGLDVVAFDLPSKASKLDSLVQDIASRKQPGMAVLGDTSKESDIQNLVKTDANSFGGLDMVHKSRWVTVVEFS